ncbi:MAG: hypothetical protein AABZ39_11395 [Spirochaetota bacterium]
MQRILFIMAAVSLCFGMPSYDDVLLVIREGDSVSAAAGAYFKSQRAIPDRNVVTLPMPIVDTTYSTYSTKASREALVTGIASYMSVNGLSDTINYIVLSAGFPKTTRDADSGTSECLLDVYLMKRLSGSASFISNNPYAFVKTANYNERSQIAFSKQKYGYYIVSRIDGPGLVQIKKLIDNAGASAYDQYKTGVNYVFEEAYASAVDIPGIKAEIEARGGTVSFYDRAVNGAIHGLSDISFLHLDWVMGASGSFDCRDECQTFPNIFKRISFKPGAVASCFRSFPMASFNRKYGGLNAYLGGSVTSFLASDGADLALRHQNGIALNTVENNLWCAVGFNPFFITPNSAGDIPRDESENFRGNGVVVYDKSGNRTAHYTTANTGGALLSDNVYFVKYDPYNNRVWAATYRGLCYFDCVSRTWKTMGAVNVTWSASRAQIYDIYIDPTTAGQLIYFTFSPGLSGFALNPTASPWSFLGEYRITDNTVRYIDLGLATRRNIRATKTASDVIWASVFDGTVSRVVQYNTATSTKTFDLALSNVYGTNFGRGNNDCLYNIASAVVNGTNTVYVPVSASTLAVPNTVFNGILELSEGAGVSYRVLGMTNGYKCDGSAAYTDRAFKVFLDPRLPGTVYLLVRRYYYKSDVAKFMQFDAANPTGVELKDGSMPIGFAVNDAAVDNAVSGKIWFVRSYTGGGEQEILPDFFDSGLTSGIGGTSHDTFYYDGVSSFPGPADKGTISTSSAEYKRYSATTAALGSLAPQAMRMLDGYSIAEARFGSLLTYPIQGGGGYEGHQFIMDPKSTPYAPRVDLASIENTMTYGGGVCRVAAKLLSPMANPALRTFIASTIHSATVVLKNDSGVAITPSSIDYIPAENKIVFSTAEALASGTYHLTLRCGVNGIKNAMGAALVNTRPHEHTDEITIDYSYVAPDITPPVVSGAPDSCTTNCSFTIMLTVDKEFGYWTTNSAAGPFTRFGTAGASVPIPTNMTLWYYGRDALGNNSVTNSRTYIVDRSPMPIALTSVAADVMPLRNLVRMRYALSNAGVTAAMTFDITPAGSNQFTALPGTISGAVVHTAGGTFINDWKIPVGFDTKRIYDLRVTATAGGRSSASIVRLDLSRLFAVSSSLDNALAIGSPYRGGEGITFVNLTDDASVAIFSLSGKKLAQLPAANDGSGSVLWQVRTDSGTSVAPGIYLCCIKSRAGTKIMKVMVAR